MHSTLYGIGKTPIRPLSFLKEKVLSDVIENNALSSATSSDDFSGSAAIKEQ